ncbi:MAG: NAD(P)/FAD-dependent oxidoreductase, partial [Clostridia bacterium]|nr:NAD(P)/FAD-dependent oxidoreductase [Clostridia bacterium]
NNKTGSKMARFCVTGNAGFDQLAAELDIPYKRTGKLVVGFTEEDREKLLAMKRTGDANGVPGLEIVDRAFIASKAPCVKGEFALWSPSTGILNPFLYTIGLAENAAKNGVEFFLNREVTEIVDTGDSYRIQAASGEEFASRYVVNCAGLGSDKIAHMLGIHDYTIYPCKGEYFLLDQKIGPLLPLPAYPVPNIKTGGLGIHLTPSVDGNVFVGPSTEYIEEREDYAATRETMDMLIEDGSRIFPFLKREYFIRNFAGVRPKLAGPKEGGYRDFVIERREDVAPRAINLVGIESPGLTSAVPIAREIVRLLAEVETLQPNPDFDPERKGIVTFADKSPAERKKLIETDPEYGEIVCRCNTITKAEVRAAIRNPLGVHTVTGVKYRCRTMMGRCQGGYCQTRVTEMIMKETGLSREEVLYSRPGSWMFSGKVREE